MLLMKKDNLESLAFAETDLPPLNQPSIACRLFAAFVYLTAGFIYRFCGYPRAQGFICYLNRKLELSSDLTDTDSLRIARRSLTWLRILGRCVGEEERCLSKAVPLTAALMALGLQSQLVIGRARADYYGMYFGLPFHAWAEINGIPLVQPAVLNRFTVLLKVPNVKSNGSKWSFK